MGWITKCIMFLLRGWLLHKKFRLLSVAYRLEIQRSAGGDIFRRMIVQILSPALTKNAGSALIKLVLLLLIPLPIRNV